MSDQQPHSDPPGDVDPTVADPVGMGVSSERVGPAGPGQVATDGVRDTSAVGPAEGDDVPPEQRPGQVEHNAEGLDPKAGYPALDPRSDEG
jgi:hypothetical protein